MIKIICLISGIFIGDDNNARGTARSFASLYPTGDVSIAEHKIADSTDSIERDIEESITSEQKVTIIAAGNSSIATAKSLKAKYGERIFVSWSAHQLEEGNLADVAAFDQVAIARGAVSHEARARLAGKLIETTGVPHNLLAKDLDDDFEALKSKIAVTDRKKILVVLSGDAPDSTGTQHLYTSEEALKFASYIITKAQAEDCFVYVTNGPRTGKFLIDGIAVDTAAHRSEAEINIPTDPVSSAFIEALTADGFRDFQFFDFRYGQQSYYKALLRICDSIYLPGESISMVSEGSDFKTDVTVYHTGSMPDSYYREIDVIRVQKSFISVLDTSFVLTPGTDAALASSFKPAAQEVAEGIQDKLIERSPGTYLGK